MQESGQLLKIGEVAETLAISIRTIRYYEEERLITPLRTDGGTRLYSRLHMARLRAILRLTESGYSLGVIKSLAHAREKLKTGSESQKAISGHLEDIQAGIQEQVQQLHSLAEQISAAKSIVKKCSGCKNMPTTKGCPDCPVRQHLPEIELLNLLWDQEG